MHNLQPLPQESVVEAVERVLDKFMTPLLHQQNVEIVIIVGNGLHSNRFINGKNPLRVYVENYLVKLGVDWASADLERNFEGMIRVHW
ncbi:MAG: hypothetical protein AAGF07_01765 [Patescibacteria group bacterium]